MEDSGKRLIIAVAVSVGIMFVWQQFFAPPPPAKKTPVVAPAEQAATKPADTPAVPAPTPVASCAVATAKSLPLRSAKVAASISECGGALATYQLIDSQYHEFDKDGRKLPRSMVPRPNEAQFFPLQVSFPESTVTIDPAARWTITAKSATEVEASLVTDKIQVVKTFTLAPDKYAIDMKVSFKNLGTAEIDERLQVDTFGYQDPAASGASTFSYAAPHFWAACYQGEKVVEYAGKSLTDTPNIRSGGIKWAGINHRYFLFAVAPRAAGDEKLDCVTRGFSSAPGLMQASVRFPSHKLAAGATVERLFSVFMGPKLVNQLEDVGTAGGGDAELSNSVYLGWFSFLARPMLWLLKFFHGIIANWGIAIILLTITVKLLTLYWTTKSMRSMKAMSGLKPKMDELQKKYADDKQRLNTEMMNLYKTNGVNPLGGCLPMLLQMPVWIALYNAVQAAAELYQAPFALWLTDLTRPDDYYVIPVLMTVLMFAQQKLTPTTIDSAQQRMMLWLMPLMFGSMSLFFPSGLTLYMLSNSVLTMLHQIYMNKTTPPPVVASTPVAPTPPPSKPSKSGKPAKA